MIKGGFQSKVVTLTRFSKSLWCTPQWQITKKGNGNACFRLGLQNALKHHRGTTRLCMNSPGGNDSGSIMRENPNTNTGIPIHKLRLDVPASVGREPSPSPVILLSCGSFNPIHNVHLRMFECAKTALESTGKFVVLGGYMSPVNDAYGKKGLIHAKHRLEMCKLATDTSDVVMIDTWEAQQPCWTPTLSVLKSVQDRVCTAMNVKEIKIMILCGSDLVESFQVPDLWSDEDMKTLIFKQGIVCIARAGCSVDECLALIPKFEDMDSEQLVYIVENDFMSDLSSTKIRQALKENQSLEKLTPKAVAEYISTNQLYR